MIKCLNSTYTNYGLDLEQNQSQSSCKSGNAGNEQLKTIRNIILNTLATFALTTDAINYPEVACYL